mgnify:CR=1 FL=1
MVDRVAQDRNETEDYSMKNEMENGQEPQENGEKPRCTAIILAAGSGSRMQAAGGEGGFTVKRKATDLVCLACGGEIPDY